MSKYLIFKANQQRFALKTQNVINVVENVRLIHRAIGETLTRTSFNFKGISIPFISFNDSIESSINKSNIAACVLIAEVKIYGTTEIIGISVDEITEVSEIDDIMSYPFITENDDKPFNMRDAILIHNNEPLIILNINKKWSGYLHKTDFLNKEVSVN